MKKSILLFVFFLAGMVSYAQELSLDEVLAKYMDAAGAKALRQINTVVMTGTIQQQDLMPAKIVRMRPDRYLMQFDVADITAYQGYDGQTGWWTLPWTGNANAQPMPDDRLSDLKTKADFDGLLIRWKEKGHQVELAGRDTVEQAVAVKLKITKSDGKTEYLTLDATTYLPLKRTYFRLIRGKEVVFDLYYRDYRPVEGIPFPFTMDTHIAGQPYNSLQFDGIELNTPVDPAVFRMPRK